MLPAGQVTEIESFLFGFGSFPHTTEESSQSCSFPTFNFPTELNVPTLTVRSGDDFRCTVHLRVIIEYNHDSRRKWCTRPWDFGRRIIMMDNWICVGMTHI
jgi:hypothetical protein